MKIGINDNIPLTIRTPDLLMSGIAQHVKQKRLEKGWTQKMLESKESTGSVDLPYKYGGSYGGGGSKVFIKTDGREWLVKFKATTDPVNVGETEYNHSLLAKECGVRMAETRLFDDRYFGVERFDRAPQGKIHVVSAAGLINAKYRIPSIDYSLLLKLTQK